MVVLDAFAVIALLQGEPAASEVSALLEGARLPSTGVAEVIDQLVRVQGRAVEDVALDLAELGLLDAVSVEAVDGLGAGLLRAQHYHRSRRAVSQPDCVVAQMARRLDGQVATADPHLLDLCHAEGIRCIVLPDSAGRRWEHR